MKFLGTEKSFPKKKTDCKGQVKTRALISIKAACLSKQVWQKLYKSATKVIKVATLSPHLTHLSVSHRADFLQSIAL